MIEPPDEPEHDQCKGDDAHNCKKIGHVVIMRSRREQDVNGRGFRINNS